MHPFFQLMQTYHETFFPFHFIATAMGFIIFIMLFSNQTKWALPLLGSLWVWNGLVLFIYTAFSVNPAIYTGAGILFPLQGLLLGHLAFSGNRPEFSTDGTWGKIGITFMFAAIFIYPVIEALNGHFYPAVPMFPEPCPLTIFTFGFLMTARSRVRAGYLVIPFIWSLFGIMAIMKLGVVADALEVFAGVFCSLAILYKNRRMKPQCRN